MQNHGVPMVTAATAGFLLIGQMWLALLVVGARRRARESLGVGSDPRLVRAVRRHANYAENAAIFVVCLGLLELLGGQRFLVAALATVFLLGRVSHAIGLSMEKTSNRWRVAGVFATVAPGIILGVRLILASIGYLTK